MFAKLMDKFNVASLIVAVLISPALMPATAGAVDVFSRNVCDRPDDAGNKSVVCKDNQGKSQNPLFGRNGILTSVIEILSTIVGIVAVITIILAGLKFITSGSNPQDVNNARERIIYAVVALVLAISAQALVQFVLNKL